MQQKILKIVHMYISIVYEGWTEPCMRIFNEQAFEKLNESIFSIA